MPSVPAIGEFTVCEINRDFLTAKDDVDKSAQESYSKILGRLYPCIPYQARDSGARSNLGIEEDAGPVDGDADQLTTSDSEPVGFFGKQIENAKTFVSTALQNLLSQNNQGSHKSYSFQGISWHKQRHWVAFIGGQDQVLVHDFEDADPRDPAVLANDTHKGVECVEWRPNAGSTLAVACRGGIAIWSANYPGNMAPVRSGVISILGTPNRGTGARWALVDFLRTGNNGPVTALSWSPNGRLLASASKHDASFTIWDVAQGVGTPLQRGLGDISLLKWSPTGDYFVSAKHNGVFHLWETSTWTSVPWASVGGSVVSAMWSPDGKVLLAAFDQTTSLAALHFAGKAPSLDVHLLPLDLPDIEAITGRHGAIERMAWDGTGERLAVTYSGAVDATYSGLIAIFDTRQTPIVSTSLLGFIRGPGVDSKPVSLAFHDNLKQGALLSVCWSTGACCTYPLLFRGHGGQLVRL
ncbi:hypothetical protein M758_3G131000 [Ceratodon purpureus]|nr:hypothetical protein M758_3G131000 [Ceratodon purpureus]